MSHSSGFMAAATTTLSATDPDKLETVVEYLSEARARGGRVFVLGLGGSAATASHFVNDLRKLCRIEAYCPTDNVSEYSARVNDEGREAAFAPWLEISRLGLRDVVFIISVGGGAPGISQALTRAAHYAWQAGVPILAVLGRDGGEIAKLPCIAIIIPPLFPALVTPLTEGLASVILHAIVSHPLLQLQKATW